MGLFHPFLDEPDVAMIGVEAGGHGVETGLHAASLTGGAPGVLHGNRTYLLQDDDGQIRDAHSISAGLDYPGIGPEHAWLHDLGRVEYVSITDREALEAFQLCEPARGHHPGAGAGPRAGSCRQDRADPAARPPDGDEHVRPRRQGHLRRRRPSRGQAVSRIEKRALPDLRAEGRAGLVTYLTAGDPDPDTSARCSPASPRPAPI